MPDCTNTPDQTGSAKADGFTISLDRAIDCASMVVVNGFEIDEFSRVGQEHVLGCSGVIEFKAIDKEIEVNCDGQATLSGYARETSAVCWSEATIDIEFRVSRPMVKEDTE